MAYYITPRPGSGASVATFLSGQLGGLRQGLQEEERYQDIKRRQEAAALRQEEQDVLNEAFRASQVTMAEEAAADRRRGVLRDELEWKARNTPMGTDLSPWYDDPLTQERYGDALQAVFGGMIGQRGDADKSIWDVGPLQPEVYEAPGYYLGTAEQQQTADVMAQRDAQAAEATRQFGVTSDLARDQLAVSRSTVEFNQAQKLKDELEQEVFNVFNLHAGAVSKAENELAKAQTDFFKATLDPTATDDQMGRYQSRVTAFEAELAQKKSAAMAMQEAYATSGTPVPVQAQMLASIGRWGQASGGMNLNVTPPPTPPEEPVVEPGVYEGMREEMTPLGRALGDVAVGGGKVLGQGLVDILTATEPVLLDRPPDEQTLLQQVFEGFNPFSPLPSHQIQAQHTAELQDLLQIDPADLTPEQIQRVAPLLYQTNSAGEVVGRPFAIGSPPRIPSGIGFRRGGWRTETPQAILDFLREPEIGRRSLLDKYQPTSDVGEWKQQVRRIIEALPPERQEELEQWEPYRQGWLGVR